MTKKDKVQKKYNIVDIFIYLGLRIILLLMYLPFFAVHCISSFVAFFVSNVIGYRKKVIYSNLRTAFPEKTEKEIRVLRRRFYRFFADTFLEFGKSFKMSSKAVVKRFSPENAELLQDLFSEGRNVLLVTGHFNNWEWPAAAFPLFSKHKWYALYKPIKNRKIDEFVCKSRSKHGMTLVPIKETGMMFRKASRLSIPSAFIFIADQSPTQLEKAYWTTFLNHTTGFIHGAEVYAKLFDMPVVYYEVLEQKRSKYKVRFEMLCKNPKDAPDGQITVKFAKALEESIIKQPDRWLWSHRRWKKQKPDYKPILK